MILRVFILFLLLHASQAVEPTFTNRGKTDFDTFLILLNPYGRWFELSSGQWAYQPFEPKPYVPYSNGQWVYSDFGWHWKGAEPHAWATHHYGTWRRVEPQGWVWVPDGNWQAATVDFSLTKTHIGWRPSVLDRTGKLLEPESVRYGTAEEWIFAPLGQFVEALTPAILVAGSIPQAQALLEESQPLGHTFTAWRDIERTGPDPYQMFAIKEKKELTPVTTWSLPTFWAAPPANAKKGDLYYYRPQLFQDRDGIQRRIAVWHDPTVLQKARGELGGLLGGKPGTNAVESAAPSKKKLPGY